MTMDITQAFNNNPKLQQFLMTDVTYTGRVLGKGSFGSVVEVNALQARLRSQLASHGPNFCLLPAVTHDSSHYRHMWQSQVENEHYSTVSGLIR